MLSLPCCSSFSLPTLCIQHCALTHTQTAWLEYCHFHDTYGPWNCAGNMMGACTIHLLFASFLFIGLSTAEVVQRLESLAFLQFTRQPLWHYSGKFYNFTCSCLNHKNLTWNQVWRKIDSHHGHRTLSHACGKLLASRVHGVYNCVSTNSTVDGTLVTVHLPR